MTNKKKIVKQRKQEPITEIEKVALSLGGKVGAPAYYLTVDEFNRRANDYALNVKNIEVSGKPCISGLAMYMGFESKQSLYDYGKRKKFSYSVSHMRQYIENAHENRLYGERPQGAIFALSCMGWHATTETINTNNNLTVEI